MLKTNLMQKNLMTPDSLADRWKLTVRTLGQWRCNGRGPKYVKIGKEIFYRIQAVESFEESKEQRSTSALPSHDNSLTSRTAASSRKKSKLRSRGV